jgi:hypothetical protein
MSSVPAAASLVPEYEHSRVLGDACPNLSTLVSALEADLSVRLQRQQRALERIDVLRSERDRYFDALRHIERACEQGAPASTGAVSSPPATTAAQSPLASRFCAILAHPPD